jgi:hypothetical protein
MGYDLNVGRYIAENATQERPETDWLAGREGRIEKKPSSTRMNCVASAIAERTPEEEIMKKTQKHPHQAQGRPDGCAWGDSACLRPSLPRHSNSRANRSRAASIPRISLGFRQRLESTHCSVIGNDNGGCTPVTGTLGERMFGPGGGIASPPDFNYLQSDNGNLNYKKGDVVSVALKGTHELYLKAPAGLTALAARILAERLQGRRHPAHAALR